MPDKRTVSTQNIKETGKAFDKASNDFNQAVNQLTNIIGTYLAENKNEASDSVNKEWNDAKKNMEKVRVYLQEFGKGLNNQANSLDQAFEALKWK